MTMGVKIKLVRCKPQMPAQTLHPKDTVNLRVLEELDGEQDKLSFRMEMKVSRSIQLISKNYSRISPERCCTNFVIKFCYFYNNSNCCVVDDARHIQLDDRALFINSSITDHIFRICKTFSPFWIRDLMGGKVENISTEYIRGNI